jgi:hypothetical protein
MVSVIFVTYGVGVMAALLLFGRLRRAVLLEGLVVALPVAIAANRPEGSGPIGLSRWP